MTYKQLRQQVRFLTHIERLHIQKYGVFPALPSQGTDAGHDSPDVLAEARALTLEIRKLTRMANRARIARAEMEA